MTELDFQIEQNAKEVLNREFPNFEFVGEEGFKGGYDIFNNNYFCNRSNRRYETFLQKGVQTGGFLSVL